MAIKKSSNSGIPFGNTAGRPTAATGQPYFNGELGRLELYTSTGWQNIVQETPGIASITGTYNESAGSGTFVISGTNFVTGGLVYAVGTNGTEYAATTSTTNSIVQMTAVFTALSSAYEPYDVKVLNPSNLFGLLPDAFYINDSPVWSTTAGSLGAYTGSSIQLSATDDESNTITYTVVSGSLPSGLSLSSSGLISGTATSAGTFTFTVSASDGINTAVTRSFSINVYPTVTGGTLSSDSTYYYRTFTSGSNLVISNDTLPAEIVLIAGGGGGAGGNGDSGGGGAGGLLYASSSYAANTYPVVIGSGGAGGAGQGKTGTNGLNSTFSNLTAIGGGGGGGWNDNNGGQNGGSGGGAGGGTNIRGLGTAGQGYNGGLGIPSSPYPGGGGGGSGAVGSDASGNVPGSGGNGTNAYSTWLSAITSGMSGISGWATATSGGRIAGGGSGGTEITLQTQYSGGGAGGGGTRGDANNGTFGPTAGITNTGSGGGAAGMYVGSYVNGANGGSGLMIIRYTKASVGG